MTPRSIPEWSHAHFSIDVLAAPFGSYAAVRLQRLLRRCEPRKAADVVRDITAQLN